MLLLTQASLELFAAAAKIVYRKSSAEVNKRTTNIRNPSATQTFPIIFIRPLSTQLKTFLIIIWTSEKKERKRFKKNVCVKLKREIYF